MYRVQIEATHLWRKSLCSPALPEDTSDILCYLDGRLISVERLVAPDGIYETVQFFTPCMIPGTHTLRLFWENVHSRISLKIKEIRLQRLGGPDANGNGVKDWVEVSIGAFSSVEAPVVSVTSPLCLEGKGRYSDMISVAACGANIATLPSPDDRWYADVPLAPTGVTAMVVSFQNGGLILQAQTAWTALNMFELASESTSTVRKGDCMKLTAHPAEPGEGTVTITGAGQTATGTPDTPAIFAFTNAGTYTITGTWTSANGNPVTRTFTVKVLSGGFPTNPAACLVNVARPWTCTNLPSAAVVDVGDTNKVIVTQQTLTQGRKLTVTTREPYFPRYILARAGTGGPILASQKLEPFSMRAAMDGFFWVAQVYPDGRHLWYNEIVAARVPATVNMHIQVIVGGVTFDDLTVVRWITRANLTLLDEYTIGLIRGPQVTTSSCHSLKAYQNGEYVGEATYY
jgi:hypothetical protein